jgi:cytochrome c oxidase cbb3-type subunit I/II
MSSAASSKHGSIEYDQGVVREKFSYDDTIVRMFLFAMYGWGIVAFLVGLIVAVLLVLPGIRDWAFNNGMLWLADGLEVFLGIEYLNFGRLRPLHTNAAIFAFVGNAIFAGIYYSTQRLCKARMWSDTLSRLHFWGWQLIIVSAALTLPLGITQGKEYAELEWPIDLMIAVVWLAFFGGNFLMTLVHRRERHMYVALWFYIATIVTVTVLHVFNNLAIPLFGPYLKSYPIYSGVQDAMMQWWYGHNAVAFFLTTPVLGLMYYFVPKAAERPVFSYRLSIVHFWSLVFIYIWAGPHHLHYSSIADWASTLGMVFSLMLWMPSWGGMINGLLTLRGAWHKVVTDPILKFFVVGITFYGMSTFEGPMLSIKAVNSLSHFTDWTIAHVHSGALGWNGLMAFGMMYWLLPRLYQTKLWSTKLAEAHFWLATLGILIYIIPIYWAGITQGLMLRGLDENGQLLYPEFIQTVRSIMPMYYVRAIGGTLFLVAAILGGVNYYMTWRNRARVYTIEVHEAPALSRTYSGDPVKPASQYGIEVVATARKLDVFSTLWWHRRWERLPVRFTVLVLLAVGLASGMSLIPAFLIRSNIPTIASVQPYTPLELAGRDIYVAEGCYNCHSQQIRPTLAEVKRYGEFSKPGESIYDHPFQWGSRRIGPDLAREGGLRSDHWHYKHFWDAQTTVQGSIMPRYPYLHFKEIDFKSIPSRVRVIHMLHPSDPGWTTFRNYDGRTIPFPLGEPSMAHAREQARGIARRIAEQEIPQSAELQGDALASRRSEMVKQLETKQVVALIAYLQRLGTDLYQPAPTPAAVAMTDETRQEPAER